MFPLASGLRQKILLSVAVTHQKMQSNQRANERPVALDRLSEPVRQKQVFESGEAANLLASDFPRKILQSREIQNPLASDFRSTIWPHCEAASLPARLRQKESSALCERVTLWE